MMEQCPVCKSAAEVIEPGRFDGKTFRCSRDGEFDVVDTVLKIPRYMDADSAEWQRALQAAKSHAAPGERPKIFTYSF
jgi:hypothetical protein